MKFTPDRQPEVIGPVGCPIMFRWTLLDLGFVKLLRHEFPPGADDADPHDHPRSFVTFVYEGSYIDVTVCPDCDGHRYVPAPPPAGTEWPYKVVGCVGCDGTAERCEEVEAPAFRYRDATHTHITRSPSGAKTLVLMGPVKREWGFRRNGAWIGFRDYLDRFGQSHRCPD